MLVPEHKIYPKPPTPALKSHVLSCDYEPKIDQIIKTIESLDCNVFFTKRSKEKNRLGKLLFNPKQFNKSFKEKMYELEWTSKRVKFQYSDGTHGCYEVDFYKDKIAVELQLGKYAFLTDNAIKFDIFRSKYNLLDLGVLIVPDKKLQQQMSSGVGCYQQIIKRLDDMNYQHPLVVISIGLNPKS